MALSCQLHAVMLRVFDCGVLLVGKSGSGKSHLALELLARGHFLVADDRVDVFLKNQQLTASCPAMLQGLLALSGVGILEVEKFYPNQLIGSAPIHLQVALGAAAKPPGSAVILGQSLPLYHLNGACVAHNATVVALLCRGLGALDAGAALLAARQAAVLATTGQ